MVDASLRADDRIAPAIETCAQFMAERGVDIDGISGQRAGWLLFAAIIQELKEMRGDHE